MKAVPDQGFRRLLKKPGKITAIMKIEHLGFDIHKAGLIMGRLYVFFTMEDAWSDESKNKQTQDYRD